MELIPYTSREGREIVLRHRNALVVRDPSSQRLEIRGLSLTECPTCHQSLRARSSSPERHFDIPAHDESYVDPNYFRMLQAGHDETHHADDAERSPPSPIRRLTQPALPSGNVRIQEVAEAEFLSSTPAPQAGARIRRNAFSPNYFNTFFVEESELGRGGKGVVLLVRHEIDGCQLGHFACKRVPVGDDHAWLEKVLVEVELLAKLSHPNLVSYRHVWLEDYKPNRFGPSVACAFILQQYCNGGDLLRYIVGDQPEETTKEQLKAHMRRKSKGQSDHPHDPHSSLRRLPFEDIYSLFKDIVSGLAYLHGSNYIHRDLKPSNCLLHREGGKLTCLISDFGEVQPEHAVRKSTGTTGTISYCAPEVLRRDLGGQFGNFTTKSDIFSLGMILYFLCFSRLPYLNANTIHEELEDIDQLRAEITDWKGFQDERKERPGLPAKLYQLLKKMLALEPAERPSATEVLTVMNLESNTGGLRREGRSMSPPVGLRGRRVQNLDSPMPPGTPIADPLKKRFRDTAAEEVISSPDTPSSPLRNKPPETPRQSLKKDPNRTSPRYRPHAMALSRSEDGYRRSAPDLGTTDSILAPTPSPPLLMPPPTTFLGRTQHRALVAYHQLDHFYHANAESIVFPLRLSFFLIKMASLARLCWPYMVNLGIGSTLTGIAAMDLGMPHSCAFELSYERMSQRRVHAGFSRWRWDERVSFALLLVHFAVVWSISRWSVLCAW
ncbi:kinase-like domain-containing protein [Pseudomassariella vexata]|uniref:non-specific serine/threonine protein kinase n=1 Tax=Pseudomassariella vexata TaxID=1141098 RepID=A0A1Y2E621_9PEZI|nr:kinase-like domain-containing protein [Pseudomassariella vexata]ORY67010.1 kinase-like domain-containing protein [Pseudomassariella vexata]